MELSSIQANEKNEKIRVSSAEIVVHGTRENPYYEIKYHDLSDGQTHVGYSSYNLDFVFEWLEECFEIVNQAADTIESLSAKLEANMVVPKKNSVCCGGECLYWNLSCGGCTIHNTIPVGCEDFCSRDNRNLQP